MINSRKIILNLVDYVENEKYSGYDPYDGLNSKLYNYLPLKSKYIKIAWIQFFKLFPINLRKVFLIDKGINPKGLGLFLSSYVNLHKKDGNKIWLEKSNDIVNLLKNKKSKQYNNYCWGYNFDWQSRAFYVPKDTPTIIHRSLLTVY